MDHLWTTSTTQTTMTPQITSTPLTTLNIMIPLTKKMTMPMIQITFRALVTVTKTRKMRKIQNTCLSAGVRPWSPCRILICFTTVDFPLPPSSHIVRKIYVFGNFTRLEGLHLQAGLKGFCGIWRKSGSPTHLLLNFPKVYPRGQNTSPPEVNIFMSYAVSLCKHFNNATCFSCH